MSIYTVYSNIGQNLLIFPSETYRWKVLNDLVDRYRTTTVYICVYCSIYSTVKWSLFLTANSTGGIDRYYWHRSICTVPSCKCLLIPWIDQHYRNLPNVLSAVGQAYSPPSSSLWSPHLSPQGSNPSWHLPSHFWSSNRMSYAIICTLCKGGKASVLLIFFGCMIDRYIKNCTQYMKIWIAHFFYSLGDKIFAKKPTNVSI
jgi:hypothetical protein